MHGRTGEQNRALGQAAARFVHRNRSHIRSCRHSGNGQIFSEIEVCSVRFVRKAQHTVLMGELYNLLQIGADAVIGGVVYQNCFGIGIGKDCFFYFGYLHAKRDTQTGVTFGVHINRNGAAQNHRAHNAAVDIAGKDNLFAAFCNRKHHRLNGGGGSAHHQKGVGSAECLRGQLLGFFDNRNRMAQVIKRLHRVYIHADAFFAQQRDQFRISSAAFVPGYVERNNPHFSKIFKSLVDGSAALVKMIHSVTPFNRI